MLMVLIQAGSGMEVEQGATASQAELSGGAGVAVIWMR